ncbi:alpha-L-fucosidase [Mucilaginibacter ginsenosidivorax]|uniref:alpha-L-fucosidase n=1 Tax=Mucilaginibacter ginsenosidivorax TaxID=862126 RepID=A0A5B8W9N7_9SPHI|nr:alpha-L-fucosidase [Mucilaginibacter ginsenosidivorax]QEC79696.1 alpha-L-fucosidase [Mucilaginibacter ginsenosidivorax]
MIQKFILGLCLLSCGQAALAQNEHEMSTTYQVPKDSLVRQKLAQWRDQKFGLFMHWGTYSQWGVAESWTICPDDWVTRTGPYSDDYFTYKKAYENLQTTFNPVNFNPEKWAKAAKAAGMNYMVFTTKHHDGFSMFDTKQTDYKITDAKTPFSKNPRSNVTKEIFDAFRKDNFMIGAYFSKPDWHNQNYWWPYLPPKDHNVNYDPQHYPERWQKFKDFTYNQIEELMTGYGKVDILWLDGGWVRPLPTNDNNPQHYNQDLDMARIAKMGRSHQPGLIMVDRTVAGEFENYTTPEQEVPDKPLSYPWETCMTIGKYWSYVPDDEFKPSRQLVQTLIKIVSRGGNLLLNIAPGPDGDWNPVAYQRLQDISDWIKINGRGIYGSEPVAPYSAGNVYFTKSKTTKTLYAFWLSEKDMVNLPANVSFPVDNIKQIKKVSLMGSIKKLKWDYKNGLLSIKIPDDLQKSAALKYSGTFELEY